MLATTTDFLLPITLFTGRGESCYCPDPVVTFTLKDSICQLSYEAFAYHFTQTFDGAISFMAGSSFPSKKISKENSEPLSLVLTSATLARLSSPFTFCVEH